MHSDDKSISTTEEKTQKKKFFPENFTPGKKDIIIGKGMRCYNHEGNIMFRKIITARIKEYAYTTSKRAKSELISSIVSSIKSEGLFVKKDPDTSLWYEADDFLARDKTSQAIRKIMIYNSTKTSQSRSSIHERTVLQASSRYNLNNEFYNGRSNHYHHTHHLSSPYWNPPRKYFESSAVDIVSSIADSIPPKLLSDENPYEPVPISEIFDNEQCSKIIDKSNWNPGSHCFGEQNLPHFSY